MLNWALFGDGSCLEGIFFFNIYLFIWLRWVLVAACRIFVGGCGIFRCGARASLVATCRLLSSCGARTLECGLSSCSVVVAHGLSSPAACGILVPRPGIKPASPALEAGFLTTGPAGKSLEGIF